MGQRIRRAVVLDIDEGTEVETPSHNDVFTNDMRELVGETIKVYRRSGSLSWYRGEDVGYQWHKSWLQFVD